MRTVEVRAGRQRYEVLIGSRLLEKLGALARAEGLSGRCAVISDANVAPLFSGKVVESLRAADFTPEQITIPAGESSKSLAQAGALCAQLSATGFDRASFLVSLGGGVVGDLVGFVASIFLRGIPYLSLPTTLLAQVDSCIGGKTGVNSAEGKNLLGTFHHPALVVADTDTLGTLPARIWQEGFAEVIKHGAIADAEFFAQVAQPNDEATSLPDLVARNLEIKAAFVAEDEREENDRRALLNFGHTVGHAIEHAAGYGHFLHGEAISLGMVAAARVSVRQAGLSLGECARLEAALAARQLPVALPGDFPRAKILSALARDKKFRGGRIRFVVLHEIGRASLSEEVTLEDLRAAL